MARSNAKAGSDVDLMVIGTISLRPPGKLLSGVATKLEREINHHVLSPEEFVKRRKTREISSQRCSASHGCLWLEARMSLKQWADNGWLRPHRTSRKEVASFLTIVER